MARNAVKKRVEWWIIIIPTAGGANVHVGPLKHENVSPWLEENGFSKKKGYWCMRNPERLVLDYHGRQSLIVFEEPVELSRLYVAKLTESCPTHTRRGRKISKW